MKQNEKQKQTKHPTLASKCMLYWNNIQCTIRTVYSGWLGIFEFSFKDNFSATQWNKFL